MANDLRIVLAEDHTTVREGIKLLVDSQPDMEVVGEAGDGEGAIKQVTDLKTRSRADGYFDAGPQRPEGDQEARRSFPDLKILMLTRHTDDGYLQQLIEAGANGYVLKQSAPTELINAIRAVAAGNAYLDPALTGKVMGGYAGSAVSLRGENKNKLTDRENEVLRLIALGYSNKEIAASLKLSVKTIEAHKSNAMNKLGVTSRIGIVRYAILQNWMQET